MANDPSELIVYVAGRRCGVLTEDAHGSLGFFYDAGYRGVPLSLSMPVTLAKYDDRVARPYFMGLLPDNEGTRAAIGSRFGVSGENPFRLLGVIGRDCPGAVQVVSAGIDPSEKEGSALVELSEGEIEEKLAAVRENAASAWVGDCCLDEGHWSLGGYQSKFALRAKNGTWYKCAGNAATTHIFKPGAAGYEHQALCEYLSMRVAHSIGLPAAEVDYRMFGEEPAIVIERYDRRIGENGDVERIHQEDLCQALGVMPVSKYANQGGPTTPRIISLLRATGSRSRENVYRFILYLFFNYLIGATDAHAKNFSLLFASEGDIRLAPLYDVASIAPYRSLKPTARKPLRAALSIGGENRFGMFGRSHVQKLVQTCALEELDLDGDLLCSRLEAMANMLPHALARELDAARQSRLDGIDALAPAFQQEVSANCRRTVENIRNPISAS